MEAFKGQEAGQLPQALTLQRLSTILHPDRTRAVGNDGRISHYRLVGSSMPRQTYHFSFLTLRGVELVSPDA